MIIDIISKVYDGRIKLQEPFEEKMLDMPKELKDILTKSNGIMEVMVIPQKNELIDIGWIIYPYAEMCKETEYYKNEYGINGIVFSSDGAGNPYYLMEGKVYELDSIDNESEIKAESFVEFFEMIKDR